MMTVVTPAPTATSVEGDVDGVENHEHPGREQAEEARHHRRGEQVAQAQDDEGDDPHEGEQADVEQLGHGDFSPASPARGSRPDRRAALAMAWVAVGLDSHRIRRMRISLKVTSEPRNSSPAAMAPSRY